MFDSAQLKTLIDLNEWVNRNSADIGFPSDKRTDIASACFDVAIEHQAAIAQLCASGMHGSMFAFLRVLLEAVVRGLWFQYCATDEDMLRFEQGKIPDFTSLTSAIENAIEADVPTLTLLRKNSWDALNGFTHTGFHQVTRRHGGGTLGPNYSDDDIVKALNFTGALGIIAGVQLVILAEREDLVDAFRQKMQEFTSATP